MRSGKWVLTLALAFSACDGVEVGSVSVNDVDRRENETFAWLTPPGRDAAASEQARHVEESIRDAVMAELAGRGYRFDSDHPDLLVDYHTAARGEANLDPQAPQAAYEMYERGGIVAPPRTGRELAEGTLVVDIAEAETRRLAWRGWGSANLAWLTEPAYMDARIAKLVKKTMRGFPRHR